MSSKYTFFPHDYCRKCPYLNYTLQQIPYCVAVVFIGENLLHNPLAIKSLKDVEKIPSECNLKKLILMSVQTYGEYNLLLLTHNLYHLQ